MMWKLQALLYKRAPWLLEVWQQFTFVEWMAIVGCALVIVLM